MSDIRIHLTFPDWLEIKENDEIEFQQEDKIIYSGSLNKDISVSITDIISEFHLILKISDITSRTSIYLLPLLINSSFKLHLYQHPETKSFSSTETTSSKCIVVEFIKSPESEFVPLPKKQFKLYKETEILGIEKKNLDVEGSQNYLKNLLTGLNCKLIQQEIKQISSNSLEVFLKESGVKKSHVTENLRSVKPSSTDHSLTENNTLDLSKENEDISLNDRSPDLFKENQDLRLKVLSLESIIESLKNENSSLQQEILRNSAQESHVQDLLSQIQSLKNMIEAEESSKNRLKSELESLIRSYDALAQSIQSLEPELPQENSAELLKKEQEISTLLQENQSLQSKISCLSVELESLKSSPQVITAPPSEAPKAETQQDFSEPVKQIFNLKSKVEDQSSLLSELLQKLKDTQRKLSDLEEYCKSQDDIIKLLTVNSQVSSTYEKLSQVPDYMDEFRKITEQLNKIREATIEFEYDFYYETLDHFKNVKELCEINLNLHKVFAKIINLMYDKDCQIYMLRHIARDALMQRKLYIPVKSDPIDVCMAEYINNRKTPMQIPFIREDTGIYNFYTRTIKVKIENNRVIVRLGGGFQGVDDFINNNTQAELDKLEERRKFGTAEAVKKLIESDFSILGLPAPIDHLTPAVSNETSYNSTANNSFVIDNISPRILKKMSFTSKDPTKSVPKKRASELEFK